MNLMLQNMKHFGKSPHNRLDPFSYIKCMVWYDALATGFVG